MGHDSRHEYFWSPVRYVLIVSILPTLFNLLVSLSPLCNWKKQNNYKSTTLPTGCVCTVYIYIYTSFHIRLRGVLWLQNWKSCCQEHRQFGSVRIYHLAGFCAWPLWHQWLGTRNPHLFNHLGSLEIPSFSSFFSKNCWGWTCMRYEVKGELGNLTTVITLRNFCYFLLLLFRAFHVGGVGDWGMTLRKKGVAGLLGSKSQTHFVAEGKRKGSKGFPSLKGFNTFKKHKTSISCSCPTDNSHCLTTWARLAYSGCDFPRIFRSATSSRCMSTRAASWIWSCEAGAIRVLEGHFLQDFSAWDRNIEDCQSLRVFGIFFGSGKPPLSPCQLRHE